GSSPPLRDNRPGSAEPKLPLASLVASGPPLSEMADARRYCPDEPNESGETGEQESEGLVVPEKPANGPPRPEPVEGRGLPGQPTVGGRRGGDNESRSPVKHT